MKVDQFKIAAAAAVAAALIGVGSACSSSGPPPNLVVIVVDSLRPDHLQLHGYPRDTSPELARIGDESLVFENAFSAGGWTKPAVTSLLLSQWAHRHGVVDSVSVFPAEPPHVFSRLRDAGYYTVFLNGGNGFLYKKFGTSAGFSTFEGSARDAAELFARLLELLQVAGNRPVAAYLQLMDAHVPYHESAELRRYRDAKSDDAFPPGNFDTTAVRRLDSQGQLSAAQRQTLLDFYDGQIRYVDRQIGAFWAELKRRGLLEKTLVVVTADHGEEFWEAGRFEHGHALIEEVLRIPLLIGGLRVPPGRRDEPVSLVDLAPTLLAAAGLPGIEAQAGRDLLGGLPSDRRLYAAGTLFGDEQLAVIDPGALTVLRTGVVADKWLSAYGGAPQPSVTAITLAPSASALQAHRAVPLAVDRSISELLRGQFDAMHSSANTELDADSIERLKSLGYSDQSARDGPALGGKSR